MTLATSHSRRTRHKNRLAWQVKGQNLTVEIPPYGTFPAAGTLSLDPYAHANAEQIMLIASNPAGEARRGFVIETYDPRPLPNLPPPPVPLILKSDLPANPIPSLPIK